MKMRTGSVILSNGLGPSLGPFTTVAMSCAESRRATPCAAMCTIAMSELEAIHAAPARPVMVRLTGPSPGSWPMENWSNRRGASLSGTTDVYHVRLLAVLLPEPPRSHQWRLDAASWVRASDCWCPDPSDRSRRFPTTAWRCGRFAPWRDHASMRRTCSRTIPLFGMVGCQVEAGVLGEPPLAPGRPTPSWEPSTGGSP